MNTSYGPSSFFPRILFKILLVSEKLNFRVYEMDEINAKKAKLALIYMASIMGFVFSGWHAMLTNFVYEEALFTGSDMGDLQSVREIPGFLAFTAVFILLFIREQTLAILALGPFVYWCVGNGVFS